MKKLLFSLIFLAAVITLNFEVNHLNYSNDKWLADHNKFEQEKQFFQKNFIAEENLIIGIRLSKDFFSDDIISPLKSLTESISDLDKITEVKSPIDATIMISKGDVINVRNFIEALEEGLISSQTEYKSLLKNSFYYGSLISKDFNNISLHIKYDLDEGENKFHKRSDLVNQIHNIFDKYPEFQDYHLAGELYLNYQLDKTNRDNLKILISCAVIFMMLILAIIYHNLIKFAIILLSTLLTLCVTLSLFLLFDQSMTVISVVLPILILVVAVSDSIYITIRWTYLSREIKDNKLLLKELVRHSWLPCLFTTFTTAVGFGSFYFSDIIPLQRLAMLSVIAIILSYFVIVITNWLSLYYFSDDLRVANLKKEKFFHNINQSLLKFLKHYGKKIIYVTSLITIFFIFSLRLAYTETNFLDVFFKQQSKIYQDFNFIDKYLGGSAAIELILQTEITSKCYGLAKEVGWKFQKASHLDKLQKLEKKLLEDPKINYVKSYLDPVRMAHAEFRHDDSIIPNDSKSLEQELLFLEFSRGDNKNDVLTPYLNFDYSAARINLQTPNLTSLEINELIQRISGKLSGKTMLTGSNIYMHALSNYVVETQFISIGITFLAIFLLLILIFNFKLAVIGIIANLIPAIITLGMIALVKIPFDFATILIAAISFAITIDSTIHFLHSYQIYKDSKSPIKQVITVISRPVIITTCLFITVFVVFIFSDLVLLIKFGIFSILAIILSLLVNLTLIPAMVARLK